MSSAPLSSANFFGRSYVYIPDKSLKNSLSSSEKPISSFQLPEDGFSVALGLSEFKTALNKNFLYSIAKNFCPSSAQQATLIYAKDSQVLFFFPTFKSAESYRSTTLTGIDIKSDEWLYTDSPGQLLRYCITRQSKNKEKIFNLSNRPIIPTLPYQAFCKILLYNLHLKKEIEIQATFKKIKEQPDYAPDHFEKVMELLINEDNKLNKNDIRSKIKQLLLAQSQKTVSSSRPQEEHQQDYPQTTPLLRRAPQQSWCCTIL